VPLRAPACQGDVEAQEHSAAEADYIEDEAMPDCPVPSQSDLAMRAPCKTAWQMQVENGKPTVSSFWFFYKQRVYDPRGDPAMAIVRLAAQAS